MPESRRRKPRKSPTQTSTPVGVRDIDMDETPRPRRLLQSIAALVIVLLIVVSMLISVVLPFFPWR